jgi:hypothetical protein
MVHFFDLIGSAHIRRLGGGYAVRAGWLARSLESERRDLGGDFAEDEYWESVVDDVEMENGSDEAVAMESLAMAVSNIAQRHRDSDGSRQRWLEVGRQFAQNVRAAPPVASAVDPNEVLRCASDNVPVYQPQWEDPSKIPALVRSGNDIRVGEGDKQNLAYLPVGMGEGRAVRALEPLPRNESMSFPGPVTSFGPTPARRVVGFRVAFDHPSCEQGENMGGCYLVGVISPYFTAYGEQNGLHHSPFFWGIEDGGTKYEGSRYSPSALARRRTVPSVSFGVDVGVDVPKNAAGVLFGCREVITVVCDFDSHTMLFWRDDQFLGSLVANLPPNGSLYPVAVPFNCGASVAITGLNQDPLPL